MNTNNRCCENYNGTLDITNSCIFCKTFIGNINNVIREEKLNTLKSMLWELGHTDKDAHHIIEYVAELLKSQREELEKRLLSYLSVQEKTKNGIIYVPECEIDQILLSNIKEE